jgi:hypothetical protein
MDINEYNVPQKMQTKFVEISTLIDNICEKHLDEEYAETGRHLTAALARKRPSPLTRGRVQIWACGILYTIGYVNFLFDPTQDPHLRAGDLCDAFEVSKSSGYNKSKFIRDLFDITRLDPKWTLPSLVGENPLTWMIMVDEVIVDARLAPRHIQVEAYRQGLIPFIPDDILMEELAGGLNLGDSVVVKSGVRDIDLDYDMSGWQGWVIDIEVIEGRPPLVTLVWDSITLNSLPRRFIEISELQNMSWAEYNLFINEVELTEPRDTLEDVDDAIQDLSRI